MSCPSNLLSVLRVGALFVGMGYGSAHLSTLKKQYEVDKIYDARRDIELAKKFNITLRMFCFVFFFVFFLFFFSTLFAAFSNTPFAPIQTHQPFTITAPSVHELAARDPKNPAKEVAPKDEHAPAEKGASKKSKNDHH